MTGTVSAEEVGVKGLDDKTIQYTFKGSMAHTLSTW